MEGGDFVHEVRH